MLLLQRQFGLFYRDISRHAVPTRNIFSKPGQQIAHTPGIYVAAMSQLIHATDTDNFLDREGPVTTQLMAVHLWWLGKMKPLVGVCMYHRRNRLKLRLAGVQCSLFTVQCSAHAYCLYGIHSTHRHQGKVKSFCPRQFVKILPTITFYRNNFVTVWAMVVHRCDLTNPHISCNLHTIFKAPHRHPIYACGVLQQPSPGTKMIQVDISGIIIMKIALLWKTSWMPKNNNITQCSAVVISSYPFSHRNLFYFHMIAKTMIA